MKSGGYTLQTKRGAGNLIEQFLESSLNGISSTDKIELLGQLASKFEQTDVCRAEEINVDQEILIRIFSFLLGKKVTEADLCSAELLQRLADSLNTMFDMLNQLVGVINMTFLGQHDGIETIRHVIGFHLEGDKQSKIAGELSGSNQQGVSDCTTGIQGRSREEGQRNHGRAGSRADCRLSGWWFQAGAPAQG